MRRERKRASAHYIKVKRNMMSALKKESFMQNTGFIKLGKARFFKDTVKRSHTQLSNPQLAGSHNLAKQNSAQHNTIILKTQILFQFTSDPEIFLQEKWKFTHHARIAIICYKERAQAF